MPARSAAYVTYWLVPLALHAILPRVVHDCRWDLDTSHARRKDKCYRRPLVRLVITRPLRRSPCRPALYSFVPGLSPSAESSSAYSCALLLLINPVHTSVAESDLVGRYIQRVSTSRRVDGLQGGLLPLWHSRRTPGSLGVPRGGMFHAPSTQVESHRAQMIAARWRQQAELPLARRTAGPTSRHRRYQGRHPLKLRPHTIIAT